MHLFTFNFLKFWIWVVTRCRMKNGEKFIIVCIFIVSCYCSAHWHDCLSLAVISLVSNYSYKYPHCTWKWLITKSFSFSKMNQLRHFVACSILAPPANSFEWQIERKREHLACTSIVLNDIFSMYAKSIISYLAGYDFFFELTLRIIKGIWSIIMESTDLPSKCTQ